MEIKIIDSCFSHTDYSTLQKSKFVEWYRGDKYSRICVFTDDCLSLVSGVECDIKIAWILEPKTINKNSYIFIKDNYNLFDYILTYDEELLAINNKFKFYPLGGCWVDECDFRIYNKKYLLSTIISNKKIISQHKPSWLGRQSLDMFFESYNIAVEYHGKQHFEPVVMFGGELNFIDVRERDIRKYDLCVEHGVKLFYFTYNKKHIKDYPYYVYSDEDKLFETIQAEIDLRK